MSIFKSKAILFRKLDYSETSVIAEFYTEEKGLRSYIVSGVRSRGKRNASSYFQYGNILEIVAYDKENVQLARLKEYKLTPDSPKNLSDVVRSTLLMFMIELARNSIKEKEPDKDLFSFIESWLIRVDHAAIEEMRMMPITYALLLTEFLGIYPLNNYSEDRAYFDLDHGSFSMYGESATTLDRAQSAVFSSLLGKEAEELISMPMASNTRTVMLDKLLDYYSLQIPQFSDLKTVPILRTIF